jgi:hypothetical protein
MYLGLLVNRGIEVNQIFSKREERRKELRERI